MEGEGPGVGEQAVEEEEEGEEEEKAAESLLFTVATCSSRGSHSEIWSCGSSWCSVFGCCLSSPGLLDFRETASLLFPCSSLCLVRWIHAHAPVHATCAWFLSLVVFYGSLYLAVICSAFLWCSVLWTFPGDDFWKNSVFCCFWFLSGYMVCQSTEGWASSTRRRASVVSSLSVAVLREFAWLVSRRTVPVHRRCQGVFLHYFYGSSFLAATCSMSFWSTRYGIFWEIHVFSVIWFDSGYMFASAHEVLPDQGVDMPVLMLDSLVQKVLRPVEVPQVQFLARLWTCPSLYNNRCVVR